MRPTRRATVVAATCATALLLSGCSLLGPGEPERDESGAVTESADADPFALRVGDCIDAVDWNTAEFASLPVVPCAEEHESEIYGSLIMDDGDFPGQAAVEETAIQYCDAEFTSFVGLAWAESQLEWAYLGPSQETWEQVDDREILCLVIDPAGLTTGSLRGAQR
jgi:hypothetical protein